MGIGNANGTPTSAGPQPKLVLWLDGSSALPYSSGSQVNSWNDKSGNGNDFLPGSSNRPVVRTSGALAGPLNRPAIEFGTSTNFGRRLIHPDFALPSSGFTMFYVMRTNDDNYGLFSYSTPSSNKEMLVYDNSGMRLQMSSSIDRVSSIGNISTDSWTYGGFTWSNVNENNWEYTSGAAFEGGFNTFDGTTLSTSGLAVIGDMEDDGGGFGASPRPNALASTSGTSGRIAEIIIYEGRLSRASTRLIVTYLWVKYGLQGASPATNWDKFYGDYDPSLPGKYYAPIGIGNDVASPNGGSINEARSSGLVLRVNAGEWTQGTSYLCAAPHGSTPTSIPANVPSTANLGATSPTVLARWTRLWEIAGNSEGNSQEYQIAFDFGEGIGGTFPQNAANYVLLYRDHPTTGNFTVLPVPNIKKSIVDDEIVFRVPKSSLITPGRYYTLGTTSATSPLTGELQRTWYAYNSGNWNNPNTWTLDGSTAPTYVNPNGDIPGLFDNVHVGAGRVVTVNLDLTAITYNNLHVLGTLNMATAPAPNFNNISGSGLIRCAASNFPNGNSAAFADPIQGGTLEFYGAGGFIQSSNLLVNKLKINLAGSNSTLTLGANLTANGLMEVVRGTLVINNGVSTARTVTSHGDVIIESLGRINVSNASGLVNNRWYFHGDLINNAGQLRFTNRTAVEANTYFTSENQQIVIAHFVSDSRNQELRTNGLSNFSRIVVNKGFDMTYILSISSTSATFFKLLGRCNYHMNPASFTGEGGNPNAFALINGTAEIKNNIFIPLQTNSTAENNTTASGGPIYNINNSAQLWVNGGTVTKGPLGGVGTASAIVPYGNIRVTAGVLNSLCNRGITLRENGLIQVDGGTVNANNISTSFLGSDQIGGVIINGGVVNADGTLPGGIGNNSYATFCLSYPGNLFRMTGGVLNVRGPANPSGLIFINSDPQNTSVSGGTVNLFISNGSTQHKIASRAAFWNLNLSRTVSNSSLFTVTGGTVGDNEAEVSMDLHDLVVRNNFSIGTNTTLSMTGSPAADLYVHGNMQMASGAIFDHNENTTHFVGSANSTLSLAGSTAFQFFNVRVNKNLDARSVSILTGTGTVAMNILGNLDIHKGTFINNNRHVDVRGNIINRSQIGNETSTGFIRMSGTTGRQQIISDGGIFHWIQINNPDGVELKNDGLVIKDRLTLVNGSFFIGEFKLRMEKAISDPILSYTATKFIVCSGNASAGGLEILNFDANQNIVFPIGVSTGSGQKYTRADIYINDGWEDEGYIRITPVDTVLTTSNLTGQADYLNFYWRVSASGYSTSPQVTHRFQYNLEDVRGIEANMESGRVLSTMPFTRSIDDSPAVSHINMAVGAKFIYYNGSDQAQGTTGVGTLLVDADYSAGAANRFPQGSSPEIYFSRNSISTGASWETPGNWNKLSECTGCTDVYDYHSISSPQATSGFPSSGDVAVIGFDVDGTMRPHRYIVPTAGIAAAHVLFTPLQDSVGNRQRRFNGPDAADFGILRPTLEIGTTTEIARVNQISGEGALVLKGDVDLSVCDIGGFLAEDSAIVIINNNNHTTPITINFLPSVVPNLFFARSAPILTKDIRVRGNFEVAGRSRLWLSEGAGGNITVEGDLVLAPYQSPSPAPRIYYNKRGSLKSIEVGGDVKLLGTTAYIGIDPAIVSPETPAPWTPDGLGAFIWLDAQDPSTLTPSTTGSSVSAWVNKGTGLYTASQLNSAQQPIYQAGGISGFPALRFNGGQFLSIPHDNALNLLANQNFEIFSVIRQNSAPGERRAIYAKGMVSAGHLLLYQDIERYRLYMDAAKLDLRGTTNLASNPNMGWGRRQGNNGAMFNTVGGGANASGVSNATMAGNTFNVTIGAANNGTDRFLNGDIGEIILIKRTLTTDERQRLEGYLCHKWGLQAGLPTGHPYKNNPPSVGEGGDNSAKLIVNGNIIQNLSSTSPTNNGLELFNLASGTSFVELVLTNEGNHSFEYVNGPIPRLWSMSMDKGINTTSSFSFNTNVQINAPSDLAEKPVNLKNGKLKFDHPSTNILLSSGGGDFLIPNSAGLELTNGTLRITGNETGLILAGSIKITGGNFAIGEVEGANNYIEYGAGSTPKIEITGGTLTVGSQIRRNLSSTGGALDYEQTGGSVIIGRYSAPELNRAMLEIVNPGSRFVHNGGTITFVRGIVLGSSPSLLINPTVHNVSTNAEIIIGNVNSPSGAAIQNFGIQSSIPLNSLSVNSNNSPVAHLLITNLELNGNLNLQSGATLNCGAWDLLLHADVSNNGTLNSTTGTVHLIHPAVGTISGTGEFSLNNLERSGGSGGSTLVQTNLLVNNNFINDSGEMDFEGNTLTVLGNVTTDGSLKFEASSHGLIMAGSSNQILNRTISGTSEIDVLTINNGSGVTVPAGFFEFVINKNLRLQSGIFSLTGNLLEMASGATFTPVNPFSESNMIVTGGAFSNFGLLLHVPANSTNDIFVPIGVDRFMPVNLDFSQPGGSSGTNPSSYLLRISIPQNGVIVDDIEDPGPEINDLENVLGMYWSIDGSGVGNGLNVDLRFRYHEQYVQVTDPYTEEDYFGARVLADGNTINKFPSAVDIPSKTITFTIQGSFESDPFAVDGDYFAGLDAAIPNTIPIYTTALSGLIQVNNGLTGYDNVVPGFGAPNGAIVIVDNNHILNFGGDNNNINFYRTELRPGSFLIIDRTSQHRLGKVTGTGTLFVRGTGVLPAGDYTEFFGCEGGALRFQANDDEDFEVLANMPPIKEVSLFGPGAITLASSAVNICNNLTITGEVKAKGANSAMLNVGGNMILTNGEFDFRQGNAEIIGDLILAGNETGGGLAKSGNNGTLTVKGNLIIGGRGFDLGSISRQTVLEGDLSRTTIPLNGSIQGGSSGAKLTFRGFLPQSITGNFTGDSKIPSLELDNATGLLLNGDVEVSEKLMLTDGNFYTEPLSILRFTEDATEVEPQGGQSNSFVDGPMQWVLSQSVTEKTFPVGNNQRHRPLSISNRNAARTWEVEYTDTIASIVPLIDPLMLPNPMEIPAVVAVSKQEHWRAQSIGGSAQANIRLSWGDQSVVSTDPAIQSNLVVLAYNVGNSEWDSHGGQDFLYDAPSDKGSVNSMAPVSFSQRFLTLGSTDALNPLPVTWLYFAGENRAADHFLSWATASETNNDYFELERSLDAQQWAIIARIEGAGSSNTESTYGYTDSDAPYGRVYYRLKQVDFDGKMDFAPNIVSLERGFINETDVFDFLLFPNPTQLGTVRFRMSTTADVMAKVSLSDLSGKLLSQKYVQIDGQGTSAPVNCNFEPGIYLVTVIVKDKIRSKPLVITK